MQELINGFFALNDQQKEYFILAIAPGICRVFQNNPDSIPRFCNQIRSGEDGQELTGKFYEALDNDKG